MTEKISRMRHYHIREIFLPQPLAYGSVLLCASKLFRVCRPGKTIRLMANTVPNGRKIARQPKAAFCYLPVHLRGNNKKWPTFLSAILSGGAFYPASEPVFTARNRGSITISQSFCMLFAGGIDLHQNCTNFARRFTAITTLPADGPLVRSSPSGWQAGYNGLRGGQSGSPAACAASGGGGAA